MLSYEVASRTPPVRQGSPKQLISPKSEVFNQESSGSNPPWKGPTAMPGVGGGLPPQLRHPSTNSTQPSPKTEHRQYSHAEVAYDELLHGRKRTKLYDSVHSNISQTQSQLLSPRAESPSISTRPGLGSTPPALSRDASASSGNYNDSKQSSDGKSIRFSSTSHLATHPLDEPSPLGLTLRKTPSLLDLISMKLAQSASEQGLTTSEISLQDLAKSRSGKCLMPTAIVQDKLKASNFPATSLKIGTWERVSRYEGDLVGKCYYAKKKLVWEVLENGLKSKIEIQWSDISAMKANCPENFPGSLEIEVSRPPLFFRETNPQPRKHTLWQATSDFTGGQATVRNRHSLQFPEGVLNRHYEKLVQCEPRLKALVEGNAMSANNDFDHPGSLFDGQHQSQHLPSHQQIVHEGIQSQQACAFPHMQQLRPSGSGMGHSGIAPDLKPEMRLMKIQPNDLASPSSVMDARGSDESGNSDTEELRIHEELNSEFDAMMYPTVHAVHEIPDVKPAGSDIFMSSDRKKLDELARELLGDSASAMSNDQWSSTVDSMPPVLVEEFHIPSTSSQGLLDSALSDHGNCSNDNLHYYNTFHIKSEEGDDDIDMMMNPASAGRFCNRDPSFSIMSCLNNKPGSSNDLLLHLPRVASLPQLFDRGPQHPISSRYDQCHMRQSYMSSEKLR